MSKSVKAEEELHSIASHLDNSGLLAVPTPSELSLPEDLNTNTTTTTTAALTTDDTMSQVMLYLCNNMTHGNTCICGVSI